MLRILQWHSVKPSSSGLRSFVAIRKAPEKAVDIFCNGCRTFLYRYKKKGKGSLVKCFVQRIVKDATAGDMKCPKCQREFARFSIIKNREAHKIIGNRVYMKK